MRNRENTPSCFICSKTDIQHSLPTSLLCERLAYLPFYEYEYSNSGYQPNVYIIKGYGIDKLQIRLFQTKNKADRNKVIKAQIISLTLTKFYKLL